MSDANRGDLSALTQRDEGAEPSIHDDGDYAPAHAAPARRRLNALAALSLVLALMLSPLAALFGHLAVGQISRSGNTERGLVIAWIAVGLGYLWLLGGIVLGVGLWLALNP